MREKLETKYPEERETICNELIGILELDENGTILLTELEKDIEKQTKILNMKSEIQKYFAVSCLAPYKPNMPCKRPYINILRGILRKQGYTFEGLPILIGFENGKSISTTKYRILRK
jgi:uncharacterized UPF0160 family protein